MLLAYRDHVIYKLAYATYAGRWLHVGYANCNNITSAKLKDGSMVGDNEF